MSSKIRSLVIVILVVTAVGAVAYVKSSHDAVEPEQVVPQNVPATRAAAAECTMPPTSSSKPSSTASSAPPAAATQPAKLPRLVDLGATKCIPCKMMAPILEELKREHAGRLDVVFIDVWENRDAIGQYGVNTIPTQIFYDAAGKERFRHQGFLAKKDILAKWKELGVSLGTAN